MLSDEELRQEYKRSAQQGLDFYRVERVAKETLRIYEELLVRENRLVNSEQG